MRLDIGGDHLDQRLAVARGIHRFWPGHLGDDQPPQRGPDEVADPAGIWRGQSFTQMAAQDGQGSHQVSEVSVGDGVAKAAGRDQNLQGGHRSGAGERIPDRVHDERGARRDAALADGLRWQFVQGVQQFVETPVDDGHQQAVQIAEVVLHHAPGQPGAVGDVPDARWREPLVEEAAHGLVDHGSAGAFGARLGAGGRPAGRGHRVRVTTGRPERGRLAAGHGRPGCRWEPGTRHR